MNAPDADSAPLVDPRALIEEWRAGIRIIHIAHTRAAADYALWERLLGLSVVLIAAVSGSTVFRAAGTSANRTVLFAAGALTSSRRRGGAHTFRRGALA